jgi:hypothetical protein
VKIFNLEMDLGMTGDGRRQRDRAGFRGPTAS